MFRTLVTLAFQFNFFNTKFLVLSSFANTPVKLCATHIGFLFNIYIFQFPYLCKILEKWTTLACFSSNLFSDETLANFIKRKHASKGEKKKQRARIKVQAGKQLKRGVPHEGKGTTKY